MSAFSEYASKVFQAPKWKETNEIFSTPLMNFDCGYVVHVRFDKATTMALNTISSESYAEEDGVGGGTPSRASLATYEVKHIIRKKCCNDFHF